ncbi:hypothetical protein ACFQMF_07270 [Halorubrum rutilum]|uniref:Uncharacterized protein n=1 Tax=Halorubrum rutilum TaxID=1364933 RepID=A0ABD6AJR2_9EURY|nr:hypothetical protein [Halorubrum rutilum]
MSSKTSSRSIRAPIRIGATLSSACWNRAVASVRAVAFWAAILLPIAYVPAAYGVAGFEQGWRPLALIVLHVACVVVGHDHHGSGGHA